MSTDFQNRYDFLFLSKNRELFSQIISMQFTSFYCGINGYLN